MKRKQTSHPETETEKSGISDRTRQSELSIPCMKESACDNIVRSCMFVDTNIYYFCFPGCETEKWSVLLVDQRGSGDDGAGDAGPREHVRTEGKTHHGSNSLRGKGSRLYLQEYSMKAVKF